MLQTIIKNGTLEYNFRLMTEAKTCCREMQEAVNLYMTFPNTQTHWL